MELFVIVESKRKREKKLQWAHNDSMGNGRTMLAGNLAFL